MTDKLKDIREGDTVEVTFRGVVTETEDGCLDVLIEGGDCCPTIFSATDVASSSFSIKKVEKPLAVGDRVSIPEGRSGTILGISDDLAWVHHSDGPHILWTLRDLERAS